MSFNGVTYGVIQDNSTIQPPYSSQSMIISKFVERSFSSSRGLTNRRKTKLAISIMQTGIAQSSTGRTSAPQWMQARWLQRHFHRADCGDIRTKHPGQVILGLKSLRDTANRRIGSILSRLGI
jgi:hypothetical protein